MPWIVLPSICVLFCSVLARLRVSSCHFFLVQRVLVAREHCTFSWTLQAVWGRVDAARTLYRTPGRGRPTWLKSCPGSDSKSCPLLTRIHLISRPTRYRPLRPVGFSFHGAMVPPTPAVMAPTLLSWPMRSNERGNPPPRPPRGISSTAATPPQAAVRSARWCREKQAAPATRFRKSRDSSPTRRSPVPTLPDTHPRERALPGPC